MTFVVEDRICDVIDHLQQSCLVFIEHNDFDGFIQQQLAVIIVLEDVDVPVDDRIRVREHFAHRFYHCFHFFCEILGLDDDGASTIEVVDVDWNVEKVLFGDYVLVEVDNFLDNDQVLVFGDDGEDEGEYTLFENECEADLFIVLLRLEGEEQSFLYDGGEQFEDGILDIGGEGVLEVVEDVLFSVAEVELYLNDEVLLQRLQQRVRISRIMQG